MVIPTFNRMDLLPRAVASVLDQTYRGLELVVVDDGSTDYTARWLEGVTDPRLRLTRLPHSGNVARVRNAGAARARGRFLCFLDSDDVWLPRKLEVQLAEATRHPGTWSYTRYEHIDEHGCRIPARAGEWRARSGRIAVPIISMEAAVSIVTVLMPRDQFQELGGFDERPRIREDYEFLVRLAVLSEAVSISDCLVLVRDHAARTTRSLRDAEPFLIGARSCTVLLESLDNEEHRRAARRRHAHYLSRAGTAHLKGVLRRLLSPLLGRESRAWRWLPWPRLRRRCFGDPIDCVIHALLTSRRRVRFVQIGSNDGVTNDPLWTFRHYDNWCGVLVEPLDSAFRRLSLNYEPWRDRFTVVRAAITPHTGTARFYHFVAAEDSREDHDQLGSLDPDHLRRHANRFGPVPLDIAATEVPSLTFRDLLATHGIQSLDLLHIDAEGSDEAILGQVDLARQPPAVILYEHVNLQSDARAAVQSSLAGAGYESLEIGADTLALHRTALAAMPALRSAWRLIRTGSRRVP